MGRAILLVVILVSTVYAGIIINVQREMYKLPEVIVRNFNSKQAENVSDYALRAAVRLGTEAYTLPTGRDTMTVFFNNYRQGGVNIEKIFYHRMPAGYYEARTYIQSVLQGDTLHYWGQIAYDYPDDPVNGPLALYNDYNAQTHANHELPDQSGNSNGPMPGEVCAIGASGYQNVIHYSPQGLDKYFSGGGGTHKCIKFGANSTNGKDNEGGWVQVPNPSAANYTALLDRLKTYDEFSIALYAMPEKVKNSDRNTTNQGSPYDVNNRGNVGTLYWAASNPNNAKFGQPGYDRPSAAIWYDTFNNANNTVTMHFQITINDATANGTLMTIDRPGCPVYTNISSSSNIWHMYTLTFSHGVMSAYYDTQLIQTKTAQGGFTTIKPNDYGFTLGMRDIRADSPTPLCPTLVKNTGTNYMFYNGLLDQISYWDRGLTVQEIENWFNNYVDRSVKYYIRD
jgi:hypothetical protein